MVVAHKISRNTSAANSPILLYLSLSGKKGIHKIKVLCETYNLFALRLLLSYLFIMNKVWSPSIPSRSKLTDIHRMRWDDGVDIRQHYTIRYSFVIQRMLPWLSLYCCILLLVVTLYILESPLTSGRTLSVLIAMLATGGVLIFGLVVFWSLYLRSLEIHIEGLRLTYSRGVMRKSTGSIVMRGHNVVNVFQTFSDYLLGLYQLQVFGSNQPHAEYALIPALSAEDAFDLFRFFTSSLSKQTKVQPIR
jgi:hypothetical protein